MIKNKTVGYFAVCLFTFTFCLATFAQTLTVRDIMREPSIAGMRPDAEKLSPDGKSVVFAWNAEGREPRNLYIVPTTGGEPKMLVDAEKNFEMRSAAPESKLNYGLIVRDDFAKAREKNLGGAEFSPNSKRLLFTQNSDIYALEITGNVSTPRRITRTQGAEFAARWLDDATILYQSGGNFFALNIEKTSLVQLSREANPQSFVSVSSAAPTEDATLLAYIVSDGSKQRALFVPNYLDEFVQSPIFRRGFTEQKVLVVKTDGSLEKPFEIKIPKSEGASYLRGLDWAADNRSLIVDRVDKDTKRRQLFYIYNVGGKDEKIITLTEETDEKWIGSLSRTVEPNPKNNSQILFASERDGFNHLYLATLEKQKPAPKPAGEIRPENPLNAGFSGKVEIKQLTKGSFEIDWAKWIADGKQIIFSSTENNAAERDFFVHDFAAAKTFPAFNKNFSVKTGEGKFALLPAVQSGMKSGAQIDKESPQPVLLYEFSKWNQPTELFIYRVCPQCDRLSQPLQITKSTPDKFLERKWNEPKFISFKAKDGKQIPAKIYLPAGFDKSKKYPSVIFVHGAGYLQNVINGWNNYYREFMFNQLLTQKGYVVLDIDYRGSAGYGRDFRTDVFDFLGGKDYEDHLDAIDYAVKNYAVDEKRVGVYGGSYGGFMAGMLVMRAPEKIAAAAALRPVFDWKNYYASSSVYTAERLGFPDKNPEAYKRSSPISYAENLKKPLLILHGLLDDNVPAQDSIQLIEKLIRLEKTQYFEAMLYPAENHAFTRPTSWADEYERILMFFEKHLKN
jgi:dipeptidyl aminopeptidase/acylaminoacyl peptidase